MKSLISELCRKHLCFLAFVAPVAMAHEVMPAQDLPKVNIDTSTITVSGVSSGAYLAAQLQVAYSSTFKGMGSIAGGPYLCAGTKGPANIDTIKLQCMSGVGTTPYTQLVAGAKSLASAGHIDPLANLLYAKIFIFNSQEDQVINPLLGLSSREFFNSFSRAPSGDSFTSFCTPDTNFVKACDGIPGYLPGPLGPYLIAHGMPTAHQSFLHFENGSDLGYPCAPANSQQYPWFPNPFYRGNDPWIYYCPYPNLITPAVEGYDLASLMLEHLYGSIKQSVSPDELKGKFYSFEQLPFVDDSDVTTVTELQDHGIGETGYVYVPSGCEDGTTACKLHVALHGCQQFPEWQFTGKTGSPVSGQTIKFQDLFFGQQGAYNVVAEPNNIVVLYPQAHNIGTQQSDTNPYGCWEFWAFFDKDSGAGDPSGAYFTKDGRQMKMIKNMVDHLANNGLKDLYRDAEGVEHHIRVRRYMPASAKTN